MIAITSKADNAKHGPQMTQMGADIQQKETHFKVPKKLQISRPKIQNWNRASEIRKRKDRIVVRLKG